MSAICFAWVVGALFRKPQIYAEGLCVVFMAVVVAAATGFGVLYILFPELAALSSDVFMRPGGKWAKEPWKLVVTPTVTAVIGLVIGRSLPYGVVPILMAMVLSIGVVLGLRSSVAPAISAGVLPIVLGLTSWLYPVCIFSTLVGLALVLFGWKRTSLVPGFDPVLEKLESKPNARWWFSALFLFVLGVGLVAQVSGWRFILFPPLVVIAYEMLGHPETCPWAKAPFRFPVVCGLVGLAGVEAVQFLGVSVFGAVSVLMFGFWMLRVFKLRMPPVLAIGLIPFILPSPSWRYAASVGLGTLALTAWYLLYRALLSWRGTLAWVKASNG